MQHCSLLGSISEVKATFVNLVGGGGIEIYNYYRALSHAFVTFNQPVST